MPLSKLALVGYGKMGRLIGELAPQYGFEVAQQITSVNAAESLQNGLDVAIEFTSPEAAPANLRKLALARVPVVCGTTGWLEALPEISKLVIRQNTGLVWSANFSTGVAVFRRLVSLAAEMFEKQNEYGAWAWEVHHDVKKDAPSGTLKQLVADMRSQGYDRTISVSSNRAGKHPGTHEIGFDSAADTLTLRHEARNREGFARGALQSANWILQRQGVFTFEDVLFGPAEK